ncbi:MAG: glycoside hydrolase family 3 N-terminal domain-containing protein [Pseudomonadota bacterium]
MGKIAKISLYSLLALTILITIYLVHAVYQPLAKARIAWSLGPEAPTLEIDAGGATFSYRDLNKNGQLDPYEDARLPIEQRIDDLVAQMTLAEKAGQMFHPPVTIKGDLPLWLFRMAMGAVESVESLIFDRHISHFNYYGNATPLQIAQRLNELQKVAERSRLGIPLTISSDPLHEVPRGGGIAAFSNDGLSKWPSQLGFAASRDPALVEEFGRIAAKEYVAMGIRTALHPMADLATEPRWGRNFGTFGSQPELSARMTLAYMRGFQGEQTNENTVHTMVKHFPGGGPQQDGWDPHLPSGKNQIYPGDQFDQHLQPFRAAVDNGLKVIMPYYGVPFAQTSENVAMGFNHDILQGLLRDELGFDGVICADWGIISSRYWGVEDLTEAERLLKSIKAGMDQFGGEKGVEHILALVEDGLLSESRIDQSVRRILRNKFELGLFEQAYVDEAAVAELVNRPEYIEKGLAAQQRSVVLLGNNIETEPVLPLTQGVKVYLDGISPESATGFATVVDDADEADYIILYLNTVFNGNQPPGSDKLVDRFLSTILPNNDLNYSDEILTKVASYAEQGKLITVVDLNRPAILQEIEQHSSAILGTFGVFDSVILQALFGDFNPNGKLPFEIPSSMGAVEAQQEDVPDDSANPSFTFGHGLRYND